MDPATRSPGLSDDEPSDLILQYLTHLDHALFLCGADGPTVRWVNARGRALLDANGPLQAAGRILACPNRQDQQALDALVRAGTGAIVLAGEERETTLIVRCRRLGAHGRSRDLAISVFTLQETADFVMPSLRTMFDLTPSEERVLGLIVGGNTADLVGDRLNVSIETVRTHIRRIYAKMGVSSREELISLAGRYRVP